MATINVPVTKAGKGVTIELDPSKLPDAVYAEIFLQGAKAVLGRGMSKVTKENYPDEKERAAAAMAAAQKNLEAAYEGKIRITGGKAKGASGVVMTEARRIAKGIVKDMIKENGEKVSHYEASEITKAANQLIEEDPSIIELAKENIEKRKTKTPSKAKELFAGIKISEKLVAKAEAKKKAGKVLSATQAGKVQVRSKGAAQLNA